MVRSQCARADGRRWEIVRCGRRGDGAQGGGGKNRPVEGEKGAPMKTKKLNVSGIVWR